MEQLRQSDQQQAPLPISASQQPVQLIIGQGSQFQTIGSCVLEKVCGQQLLDQPKAVQVDLFHHVSQNSSYLRVCNVDQKNEQDNSTLNSNNEVTVAKNVSLTHARICPQYLWSRQDNSIQLTRRSGAAACGLIIDQNGYVLLTKRKETMRTYPKCWVLPGGQIDQGETVLETVLREIKEEVGLTFTKDATQISQSCVLLKQPPEVLLLYESVYPTLLSIGDPSRSSLVIFYLIQLSEEFKNVTLEVSQDEIECSAWVPFSLLQQLVKCEDLSELNIADKTIPGLSVHNKEVSIGLESFQGIYPNRYSEGLGEAHTNAIKALLKQSAPKI